MKILAIRGKNLASLAGDFEVDFTVEPLKNAGIFAITGSTGSGKSTLLDALCLALFDSTPRMTKARESKVELADVRNKTIAQSDSRSVLRRGTAEGYAEVDFIALTGETYRSTWTACRAGGKPSGILRSVGFRLMNLSKNTEEQGTRKELLAKVSKLIGLSFEQFNRSVLLAQGDFAVFLKAKQADKAEILEKLTGTEIYSRVSSFIYAKTKSADMEFRLLQERMKGIELLSDDALAALDGEKLLLSGSLAALKSEEDKLSACLKWVEEERSLTRNKEQAENELKEIRIEMEKSAARYALLARVEQAQEIRDVFMQAVATSGQLNANRKMLAERQEQVRQTAVLFSKTQQEQEAVKKAQTAWQEYLAELTPQLNKAKELDVQITEKQKQWLDAQAEEKKELSRKEKLERELAGLRQQIKLLQVTWKEIEDWFGHYMVYADLIPAVSLVLTLLADRETADTQIVSNRKMLKEVSALQEMEQKRLKAMQEEAERLNRLLPAEVVLLRSQLRTGEPCPVCGSLHHPAATLTEVQSLQEAELNRAKEKVTQEIERLTVSLTDRTMEINTLDTIVKNYVHRSEECLSKVKEHVSILPGWQDLLDKGQLKGALRNFDKQWKERLQQQTDTKEALSRQQAELDARQHEQETHVVQIKDKQSKTIALETDLSALRSQRALLLEGRPTHEVENQNRRRQEELQQHWDIVMRQYQDLSGALESYKGQSVQLEKEVERLEVLSQEENCRITEWLSGREEITTRAELEELLSKDIVWINREKKELTALKERFTTVQAVLAERCQLLAKHGEGSHKPSEGETEESLLFKLSACQSSKEQQTTRLTQIGLMLDGQEKNRQALAGIRKELDEKQLNYENWSKLNELFGSQSGVKFKEIAQGYTLDVLLLYANKHLQDLAPRYELQRISDTLALQIVDLDMMGEVRTVHSLSCGESFLVSLALALGLSSLSSNRMNVESLFIDEGFGSLDPETFRIAMDALERLQMQGRKIGVISHVAEMTERISAQIQIVKTGNGRSRVQVAGQK